MPDTTIRVTCPTCGEQSLGRAALHLTLFDAGDGHFYEFFCPTCYELVRKPATDAVQSLLMSIDVEHTFVHVPLELLEDRSGPPLTVDDLMEFVLAMRERPRHMVSSAQGHQKV